MVKQGDPAAIRAEVHHIALMGSIAPRVIAHWDGGYAMEVLEEWPFSCWTTPMLGLLRQLWIQDWIPSELEQRWGLKWWTGDFQDRFGFTPPDWVADESMCLIHGDPTLANLMRRTGSLENVLIDPKPPGNGIPSFRTVDIGKMLQSMLGWESVLAGGALPRYDIHFLSNFSEVDARRAVFWCMIHLMRIMQREKSGEIFEWADHASQKLRSLVL